MKDPHLITVDDLREAGALDVPASWRKSLGEDHQSERTPGLFDEGLQPVVEEMVLKFPEWLQALPEGEIEFLSTGFAPYRPALTGTRFESAKVTDAPRAQAGAIGRIAAREYAAGRAVDPAAVDANYVRRADAELKWKDR